MVVLVRSDLQSSTYCKYYSASIFDEVCLQWNVQAYRGSIVCPNKHKDDPLKVYKGHLIESETYVGGHVEALNSGVYRSDFSVIRLSIIVSVFAHIERCSLRELLSCSSIFDTHTGTV